MNILYFVSLYLVLIILSLSVDQIITVKISQIYGPKYKSYYIVNSLLALIQNIFMFFISLLVCIIFYFYKFDNNLILINILILLNLFLLHKDKTFYCQTSIKLILILIFLIIYFSISHSLSSSYLFYSPFSLILFFIGFISNILFSYSENYAKKIIRLTCLNFILINYFLNTDFLSQLAYLFAFNTIQIFIEKIYPKINNLLTVKYLFSYLLIPALISLSLNYIWFYLFYDKTLQYFMGF